MRQMGLAWVAIAGLTVLGAPIAEAGVSCKVVKSWCPAARMSMINTARKGDGDGDGDDRGHGHTSVPEPATLMLLGLGAGAAGFAVRRRRKQ